MDTLNKHRRSWNMSRIRSKDTLPERIVRSVLHRLGYRFRLNSGRTLPGKPDIVLPVHRIAVFVHGCFWHRHKGCRLAYTPKSRVKFWMQKFDENVCRDVRVTRKLRRNGWLVLTVWECETAKLDQLRNKLIRKFCKLKDKYPTAL